MNRKQKQQILLSINSGNGKRVNSSNNNSTFNSNFSTEFSSDIPYGIPSGIGLNSVGQLNSLNWAGAKNFLPKKNLNSISGKRGIKLNNNFANLNFDNTHPTNPILQNGFNNSGNSKSSLEAELRSQKNNQAQNNPNNQHIKLPNFLSQPTANKSNFPQALPQSLPNLLPNGGQNQTQYYLTGQVASNPSSAYTPQTGNVQKPVQTIKQTSEHGGGGKFSQTFNKDNVYEAGVQRVFRKSMMFLAINLVSFGLLVFSGINFFSQNYWLILISALVYTALTNLFYIIVADRNYVWFGLLAQLVLIISIFSFYGLGFNPVTIVFALIIALMSFLAYSELEKVQLSSRLFSIAHLTNESTRILSTIAILVLSLGIYNGILFNGTQAFFSKYIWSNNLFQTQIFQGANPSYSLNRLVVGGRYEVQGNKVVKLTGTKTGSFTFADFLEENYRNDQPVITPPESQEIIRNCTQSELDCQKLVDQEILNRLQAFKVAPDSPYRDLSYNIETVIDKPKFLQITERHYLSKIAYFELDKEDSSFIPSQFASYVSSFSIPRKSIIPASIAILVFALLLGFKFAFHWIIFITTWLTWRILLWLGFAQIDIETVEAEIVNI